MKSLKQIREEYDRKYVPQVDESPEDLVLEASQDRVLPKMRTSRNPVPSPSKMPAMLLFKRLSYRMYPDNQVVALYYSKMVDKYLSVPFGPKGNLNINEAVVMEENDLKDACWKGYTAKGLKKKGNRMVPNCVPVSEKNDDNDYPATVERGITESFRSRLERLREERLYEAEDKKGDMIRAGAEAVVPYMSAYRKYLQGDYKGAAADAALDTGLMAVGGPLVKGGVKLGLKGIGAASKFFKSGAKVATKGAEKAGTKAATAAGAEGAKVTGSSAKAPEVKAPEVKPAEKTPAAKPVEKTPEAKPVEKTPQTKAKPAEKTPASKPVEKPASKGSSWLADLGAGLAGAAIGAMAPDASKSSGGLLRDKPGIRSHSTWSAQRSDKVQQARIKNMYAKDTGAIRENRITDIRKMINEGHESMDMSINGRTVTLNNTMAKRILEVYDSVNTKNKKIVESMLNEDLESFKKLLNFSIRN